MNNNKTVPFIQSWNDEHIDMNDYECRTLGEGCIITELNDGSLFAGTFQEWAAFKTNHLELLVSDDLLREVV